MTEYHACPAQRRSWGIQGRHKAACALADVDNHNTSLNSVLDDLGQASIDTTRRISHSESFQNQTTEVGRSKHGINHFRLDSWKYSQARHMGSVEILGNLKLGDSRWSSHQCPVDINSKTRHFGQWITVRAGKGFERGRRDLCRPVAAKQGVVKE